MKTEILGLVISTLFTIFYVVFLCTLKETLTPAAWWALLVIGGVAVVFIWGVIITWIIPKLTKNKKDEKSN